jgi:hypothetical protein
MPARVEIPHSWRLVWYTLPISRERLREEGGYRSKPGIMNQYSCLAESKCLVIKRCSESVNHSTICTRPYSHSDCSKHIFGQGNRGEAGIYKSNFGCLPSNITRLQEKGTTLKKPAGLVRKTESALENVADDIGKFVSSKMKYVLEKHMLQSNVLHLPTVNGRII